VSADPDREQVKAEAVAAFRRALVNGERVGDALRACWYRNPAFSSALMEQALRLRFGPGCDVRLITTFVARIRASRGGPTGGFPSREAEAIIRAYLGEVAFFDAVDPGQVNYVELAITILGRLFLEWAPGTAEVDDLFERAATVRREMDGVSPLVAQREEDWFEAGMPESPFAAPGGGV